MKKIRSYTGIWNVEKVIYAISDINLPFPVTLTQIAWFVGTFLCVMFLQHVPPLSFTDNVLLKYLCIPAGITWFMSQKTFDGKRPDGFLRSAIAYLCRPKVTYAGKPVKLKKIKITEAVTVVRSEMYVPN